MIIRTYQRRNRASSVNDGFNSSSQESFWSSSQESQWNSSQEAGLLSSQETLGWSQLQVDLEVQKSGSEPAFKKRKQEEPSNKNPKTDPETPGRTSLCRKIGLSLNRRWGFSAPPTSTLMEAQESGEMMEQVDEINFALDGLRENHPLRVQQASVIAILSLCYTVQQRRFLKSHGIAKPLVEALVTLPTRDPALSLAAAAVLYFLASDGRDADLLDTSSCIGFLLRIIGSELSIADSGADGADVVDKVRAIFEKAKERNRPDDLPALNDLSPKSLALKTIENACLSAVALDDNTGTVTKVGGQFKERLRELGGLDAVCNVAVSCLANLADKDGRQGGVSLLLRCLRVMENVTFLSEQSQNYLLNLKLKNRNEPITFIGLVVKAIKALQEIITQPSVTSNVEVLKSKTRTPGAEKEMDSVPRPQTKISPFPKGNGVTVSVANDKELKLRNALQKAKLLNSQRKASLTSNCQRVVQVKVSSRDAKLSEKSKTGDDVFSQDPYDFDEPEVDLILPSKAKEQQGLRSEPTAKKFSSATAASYDPLLVADCVLSAVKVLMNLTNDNANGCKQVAACNGISSVASLLVANYPQTEAEQSQKEPNLDLLVAVLGMLVNLVEKDDNNRTQLADLDVSLPSHVKADPVAGRGMISLLCSLFLSKQGSGEAAEAREGCMLSEFDSIKRGQREAENMIVEAYAALVLAFLSTESDAAREAIAQRLPSEAGLQALVPVLERFVAFHLSLNMISPETHVAVTSVINSLREA